MNLANLVIVVIIKVGLLLEPTRTGRKEDEDLAALDDILPSGHVFLCVQQHSLLIVSQLVQLTFISSRKGKAEFKPQLVTASKPKMFTKAFVD